MRLRIAIFRENVEIYELNREKKTRTKKSYVSVEDGSE